MTPALLIDIALVPAFRFLPPEMDSLAARAFLLTVVQQESRLRHRRQIHGPARSYFQFERAGVRAVLGHLASAEHARRACALLDVEPTTDAVYLAIEHHDVLACIFARLLLWTLPGKLPQEHEPDLAWSQYLSAWRPGKPHRSTWDGFFIEAWRIVKEAEL